MKIELATVGVIVGFIVDVVLQPFRTARQHLLSLRLWGGPVST